MPQLSLSSFSEHDHIRVDPKKVAAYNCTNCVLQKGFAGTQVRCMGKLKDIPLNGCACWSDGKELEYMASFAPPEGWQAKKWAGWRA
jgi:hypothetical protein